MRSTATFAHSLSGLLCVLCASVVHSGERVEYNRDVRPILSENCFHCHGPDKSRRKARLRLDERTSALTTKAIVPGKPEESELVARIFATEATELMPPPQ